MQFGEKVMFKVTESQEESRRRGSLEATVQEGSSVRHHSRSGSLLLLTSNGVIKGWVEKIA